MIKATPAQLRIITGILAAHAPGVEARAFGSRVAGNPKNYPDLNLAPVGAARLNAAVKRPTRRIPPGILINLN